jgi:hypothetical protein
MKVISVDNYARESIADALVAEGLTKDAATLMADELNVDAEQFGRWYMAVADDYRLWRGMEDLI